MEGRLKREWVEWELTRVGVCRVRFCSILNGGEKRERERERDGSKDADLAGHVRVRKNSSTPTTSPPHTYTCA